MFSQQRKLLVKRNSKANRRGCKQIAQILCTGVIIFIGNSGKQKEGNHKKNGDEQRVAQIAFFLFAEKHAEKIPCQAQNNAEIDRVDEKVTHLFSSVPNAVRLLWFFR